MNLLIHVIPVISLKTEKYEYTETKIIIIISTYLVFWKLFGIILQLQILYRLPWLIANKLLKKKIILIEHNNCIIKMHNAY